MDVIGDRRHLAHRVGAADEYPRELTVDQENAVSVGAGQSRQRLDERRVVDDHPAGDRPRKPHNLEEARARRAEDDDPARAACVELVPEERPHAFEVTFELLALRVLETVLAQTVLDDVEQRVELYGTITRRRK